MRIVERIKTCDGVLHDDIKAAKRYLDNKLGEELTKAAHKLVQIEKYSDMLAFLEANTDILSRANDISQELKRGICEL